MKKIYYDFHMHSCLSPCGDNDMTPNNIAGMSKLAGLHAVALTDHNSARNCPAFFDACERYDLVPIPGMELTTAEDIHVVCLFRTLDGALEFDRELQKHRNLIDNRVDIFGDQLIMDSEDNVVSTEPHFLTNATDITIDESLPLIKSFGGICYPAHVDRESNGVIAILGTFPEEPGFKQAEFNDFSNIDEYLAKHENLNGLKLMYGSDAHYLNWIKDAKHFFEVPEDLSSAEEIRNYIFDSLEA